MAKAIKEKNPSELADEDFERYRAKHEEIDRLKEKNRKRAERIERINPGYMPYPMSVEEAEEIDALLIDVPDEEINVDKIHEVVSRSDKGEEKKKWILEQLAKRKLKEDGNL